MAPTWSRSGRHDHYSVPGVSHGEGVLEEPERDLGETAIHVRHAAVEDADDGDDGGGERAVATAADEGQLVTDSDPEIPRQDAADDDLLRHRVAEESALLDQARQARDPALDESARHR